MDEQLLKGHLPVLVLGLLKEKPMHGYALVQEIKERGAETLQLGEGTLYPLLHRLERQGLIRAKWETGPSGKQRKVYGVTTRGLKKLAEGQNDWLQLSRAIQQLLGEEWKAI